MRKILVSYGAGALGALVTCFVGWFLSNYGVFADFGVNVTPKLTFDWLYPPLVWGSLWALLFVFPNTKHNTFLVAFVVALIMTLLQLFLFYPSGSVHGVEGPGLDVPTAIAIAVLNMFWAVVTISIIRITD